MANPTTITWDDPTTNVDGSPIAAGEITGYTVGVRPNNGTIGTYPFTGQVADPAGTKELISALSTILSPGIYFVAVQSNGPVNSAWSPEVTFTIAAPVPNPPSGLKVA